jgi:hypothetical protein
MQGEADRILTIGRDERWKCDHAVDARLRYLRERADPTKPVNTESGALDTVLHPIDSVGAKLDSLLHNAGVDSKSNDTFSPIRQDKNFDQIWSSLEALRSNGLLGNQSAAVISGTAFAGIKKVLDLALVAIDQISNDWGPDSSSRVSGSNVESNARSSGTVENQDKALEAEMKELNAALQESFNDPSFKNSLKAPKGVEVHIESGTSGGLNINDLINGLNMISQGVQAARGGGASAGNYGTTSGSASTCEAMNQNIHNKYDSKLAELEQKANSVNVSTFNQWGCQLYSVAAQMRGEIVQYAQRCRPEKVNITHAEYQQAILARDSTCARKN